jgi:hypothetical protein
MMSATIIMSLLIPASLLEAEDRRRPSLGMTVLALNKDGAAELKLPARIGVVVNEVKSDGLAAGAGIQVGDVIFRINGNAIADLAAIKDWFARTTDGATYRLTIYRRAKAKWVRQTISMRIDFVERPAGEPTPADLARWKEWEQGQGELEPDQRPYEIKGDRLGMSLEFFKFRHYRVIPGDARPAPFCSDLQPDLDNPFLLYTADLHGAKIIHASTTFPFEHHGVEPNRPTIAGAETQVFVYRFLDEMLYEMNVVIDRDDYRQVRDALEAKYGAPTAREERVYQNAFGASFESEVLVWSNEISEIYIFELAGDTDTSMLIASHKELARVASERLKEIAKVKADDL